MKKRKKAPAVCMTCVWLMRTLAIAVHAMFVSDVARRPPLPSKYDVPHRYWLRKGAWEEMQTIDETSGALTEHCEQCPWWQSLYGDEEPF